MDNYLEELDSIKEIEGYRIFCHFTDKSPETIINGELGLVQNKWYTTMFELTEDELENLNEFLIDSHKKNSVNFRDFAIIIAVPIEVGYEFVKRNTGIFVKDMDFAVENKYILCCIDIEEDKILYNDNSLAREEIYYR